MKCEIRDFKETSHSSTQLLSQVSPQAYVERFNWTLQDECLYYHLDKILEDPNLLDQAVTDWLT